MVAAVALGAFAFHLSRAGHTGRLASDATRAPLLGASVSTATIAPETSEFGHMGIVRVYYPGLPSSNAWTTGLPAANKSAVIVSFKALPRAIVSGQDDAVLSHFFGTAPTGHPIYWSYWHEPEGNITDGEFTPPAAAGPVVSGLALSPPAIQARPLGHTSITFSVRQAADVTVLVLNQEGAVVRMLARPAQPAGTLAVRYYGFDGAGHREPAGKYQVLVVASNAHGSQTAQSPMQINSP